MGHLTNLLQNNDEWGITLWRLSISTNVKSENLIHIIPIHIVEGEPQIVGKGLLKPGFKIYGNHLTIEPELDCLFVGATKNKPRT